MSMQNEDMDAVARAYLELPQEEREVMELVARGMKARALPFGVEGFKHFYWCLWRRELQPYAVEWVESFAREEWTILECFRGSGKSTDLSISFPAYCLGKEPHTSVLIVQANDDAANDTTSAIADIVEHYTGWKACFPNVVPDPARGWGAKGYNLKDTDIEYGHFLELCGRDHTKDPSFVGAGVGSADIVGKHPRRLFFDDIHDIKNSAFPKERQTVVDTVRANIIPVITKPGSERPFIGVACTPWDKNDAYQMLYETGLFKKITTPLFRFDPDGKYDFEDKGKITLTWEEGFPIENVYALRKAYRGSWQEFARMYMCDIEAAKSKYYKWYSFPSDRVDWNAPLVGGVDYASVYQSQAGVMSGRSYFAMAYIAKMPGGAIIPDGVLEQCTQAQAESYVMRAQNSYPGWLNCVIESDGVGAQFIQLLQRNPKMRVIPKRTSDVFRGKKEDRQYEILSPLLERAAVRVSDADTPFLNCLRSYLDNYPNLDRHAPEWDVADAVLWACVGVPELSSYAVLDDESLFGKQRQPNPFFGGKYVRQTRQN